MLHVLLCNYVFHVVLITVFGYMGKEVIGNWRKLHHEYLSSLHSSKGGTGIVKQTKICLTGNVVHVVERERHVRFWWESLVRVRHKRKAYEVWVGECGARET